MSIASNPDYAEGAYDELSFWSSRFGALLFEHLELRPDVTGLDIACGTGFPLFELAHAHGPSSHFTGLDVWPEAIRRAQRKLAVYGLTNVALQEGDALRSVSTKNGGAPPGDSPATPAATSKWR